MKRFTTMLLPAVMLLAAAQTAAPPSDRHTPDADVSAGQLNRHVDAHVSTGTAPRESARPRPPQEESTFARDFIRAGGGSPVAIPAAPPPRQDRR